VDISNKNTEFELLDSIIETSIIQLSQLSGDSLRLQREIINQQKIDLKNILNAVYHQFNKSDSLVFEDWIFRFNPIILDLSDIRYFLYTQQFDSITSRIENIYFEDEEVFLEAIHILDSITTTYNVTIKGLPTDAVNYLSYLATESFGDYTNILRSYLNMEYDVYIPWPDSIVPRSTKERKYHIDKLSDSFLVFPNPAKSCFSIRSKNITEEEELDLTVSLYDLSGIFIKEFHGKLNEEFCINESINGLYILRVSNSQTKLQEIKLLSFIN
jgi:hypothetical protein